MPLDPRLHDLAVGDVAVFLVDDHAYSHEYAPRAEHISCAGMMFLVVDLQCIDDWWYAHLRRLWGAGKLGDVQVDGTLFLWPLTRFLAAKHTPSTVRLCGSHTLESRLLRYHGQGFRIRFPLEFVRQDDEQYQWGRESLERQGLYLGVSYEVEAWELDGRAVVLKGIPGVFYSGIFDGPDGVHLV